MLGQRVASTRRRRSVIASSGMSTRKGRISAPLDIRSPPPWDLLTTADGRTGRLLADAQSGGSPVPTEKVGTASRWRIGRAVAPETSLVPYPWPTQSNRVARTDLPAGRSQFGRGRRRSPRWLMRPGIDLPRWQCRFDAEQTTAQRPDPQQDDRHEHPLRDAEAVQWGEHRQHKHPADGDGEQQGMGCEPVPLCIPGEYPTQEERGQHRAPEADDPKQIVEHPVPGGPAGFLVSNRVGVEECAEQDGHGAGVQQAYGGSDTWSG